MALRRQKQRETGLVTQSEGTVAVADEVVEGAVAPTDDVTGAPVEFEVPDTGESTPLPVATDRLGEVLVRQQVIDEDQLRVALEQQQESGDRLGAVLVDTEVITREQLLAALAEQFGLQVVSMTRAVLDPRAVTAIPEELARELKVVPLSRAGGRVSVAVADPAIQGIFPMLAGQTEEHLNFLLPEGLKRLGLIHYLLSLTPVKVPEGFLAVLGDPLPPWIAVPVPLLLAAALLARRPTEHGL